MTSAQTGPRLARRAAGFTPSAVRDVWELSLQPGMISLAGGNPDLSLMDLDWMAEAAAEAIATRAGSTLQYGSGPGEAALREAIPEVMAAEGILAAPESIQVTSGSQMGLDLIVKLLCDPGDTVVAEGPTYVGALGVFGGAGVQVRHVAMDHDGMVPEDLERLLEELAAASRLPRFVYTVPNFHNPTGITLATARRRAVVEVCRRFGVPIVEDNPYGLLSFTEATRPSLHGLDPDNVLYLGSFSKILSPGLRVGWVCAPPWLRRELQLAAESTTISASGLSQALATAFVRQTPWRESVAAVAARYAERADALCRALEDSLPEGASFSRPAFSRPEGGFFSWVTLPEHWRANELLEAALERNVVFIQGASFFTDGQGAHQLRLAFCSVPPDGLREGVRRLAGAMEQYAAELAADPA
ncbi:PLP-dependent aminotransferase family protein [Zhihengliuella alba]|uniref:PLP-dependent aminotransferase family protein n=1 Tax=Zhihengliuella alba TaxID=547018 RepID=A0ABP7DJS3_9MICC